MALPPQPLDVIIPLIVATRNGSLGRRFLGTGFMVGERRFMTAGHVLKDVHLQADETIAAIFLQPSITAIPVCDTLLDGDRDIATGTLANDPPVTATLTFAVPGPLRYNVDLLTCEYSGTLQGVRLDSGMSAMVFQPRFRKGNLVTSGTVSLLGHPPAVYHEVSFAALRGASGAPLLYESDGTVIGMIVANVDHELLPAQIETIASPDGIREERKYFLPSGLAIPATDLQAALERAGNSLET